MSQTKQLNLQGLRTEMRAAGIYERHEARTWGKFLILIGCMLALIGVQLVVPLWATALLMPAVAFFATAAVMIGHEGGHKAMSQSGFRNELMLHLAFPFFSGLGALFWRRKHNQQHHGFPNVSGEDSDLELWPMATSREEHERSGPLRRWFQANCQGALFWPLTAFMAPSLRIKTLRHLAHRVRTRRWDRAVTLDAACLIGHVVAWLVIPSLVFGFVSALLYWVVLWSIVGVMLAMVFAPAHMGLPVFISHVDPLRLQLETTRNLLLPRWLSFFFIGLDYQVVHHLFANVPHQNMRACGDMLAVWAKREGLPYQQIGYWKGLRNATAFMAEAWNLPAKRGT